VASNIPDINQIKREHDAAVATANRAEGAYTAALQNLKETYGVETLEDAEKLAATYDEVAAEAEAEFLQAYESYQEQLHVPGLDQ
jgi:hypothetical protein